ncbi:SulP family inorganic anion transporter [Alcanivorax sp. 1008]|uniref:SulP family inorganic anion transporter n=1 Tax=Alcanivorax sp. 1008 TaxID=2816853 RepID=UPI001D893A50|nr:sulfate permease [Alcanivorax sp. 1008]MCC1496540.1 sulfate permease [Alcanivorax sp. 1008]
MADLRLRRLLPALEWLSTYRRTDVISDAMAALIVTVMLIPQSLAYAMLAGLPAEVGLYASMLPLLGYALFGSSRTLAVGPVAVASLMTAAAVSKVAEPGTDQYLAAAVILAVLSGVMLSAMAVLRLGWIANLLSHPVIAGFITASGILIATSQLKHILGISAGGHTLIEIFSQLAPQVAATHIPTLLIGLSALAFLFWARKKLKPLLQKLKLPPLAVDLLARAGPALAVILSTVVVARLNLDQQGVRVVGHVPGGLPELGVPQFDAGLWQALLVPAFLISLIGFVESVSVAQTLAARRRQQINPNHELAGLGAANIGSALSGGFPVTGGFARSVVNFDAGAVTPMAGIFTAIGIGLTTLFLTGWFTFLPNATLAATIIVAVLSLVDFGIIRRTWQYSRIDFSAMMLTMLGVFTIGVEAGVVMGVATSLLLFLWRTSSPHIAVVGQVPGTEHFRNVNRHKVITSPTVLSVRVDESLYFANARFLEDSIYKSALQNPQTRHVVLQCSAVNLIDASALESLEALSQRLQDAGIMLHLSEIKGPVMDALNKVDFVEHLSGNIYLSHYSALAELDPETTL